MNFWTGLTGFTGWDLDEGSGFFEQKDAKDTKGFGLIWPLGLLLAQRRGGAEMGRQGLSSLRT